MDKRYGKMHAFREAISASCAPAAAPALAPLHRLHQGGIHDRLVIAGDNGARTQSREQRWQNSGRTGRATGRVVSRWRDT